jgi:hypothetical protein
MSPKYNRQIGLSCTQSPAQELALTECYVNRTVYCANLARTTIEAGLEWIPYLNTLYVHDVVFKSEIIILTTES